MSPLRFHPVEGCWDRNQDLIHTRLDLIHTRLDLNHCLARSHPHSARSRLVFNNYYVPLFKKLRDIIFFCGTITVWAISRDILRGPRLFWPLKLSRAQVLKTESYHEFESHQVSEVRWYSGEHSCLQKQVSRVRFRRCNFVLQVLKKESYHESRSCY